MSPWDKTKIAEGVLAPDLNDEIRANWSALEDALNKEMYFSTGGTASLQGILRQGSARAFFQDTAPATRADGSAFASTDLGMLWFDSNSSPDNQFNVLTATTPTWTPVSTEIIAVAVAAAHTWADVQTFSLAAVFTLPPTFTAGVAANDSYLTGTDAAGTGTVNLIKAGTNDLATLPDGAEMASSAAPTENEGVANKKYVDDQNTADHPAYTGGESHTDGSGMIIKQGNTVRTGNTTSVSFAANFNTLTRVVISPVDTAGTINYAPVVNNKAVSGFDVICNSPVDSYDWIAIGY
jgi:hypothetical protein